jgi:uncharacterized membrane protein YcaP (DUF421 family)
MSVAAMKSFAIRKLLSGKSAVIIKNGTLDQKEMKKVRLTVLDLIELLRAQNVYDLDTVAFAVLEVNGNLSVLLKSSEQPVTVADMKINKHDDGLPLPVISDGKIVNESINVLNITQDHVKKIAKNNGMKIEDVFLLNLDRFDNFTIIRKDTSK